MHHEPLQFGSAQEHMQTFWNADGNGADAFLAGYGYTVPYAAPEVVSGGRQDARADVYSFGVVMWEMLGCLSPHGTVVLVDTTR